jgi:pyroglutamyl-peptidase
MILLTGFEPFTTQQGLELTHNPTADIAIDVADGLPGVTSAVLPVGYERTRAALLEHFEIVQPRVWVGLGYAPHRTTLDIETVALNLEHAGRPDNDGDQPFMRAIIEDAPMAYRTRLDVKEAINAFGEHGVEASASLHAGAFLCNQTFFLGCHQCEMEQSLSLAAFIHVPPMDHFTAFEAGLTALLKILAVD